MTNVQVSLILVIHDQTEALEKNLHPVEVRDKTVQAEIRVITLEGITTSRGQNAEVFNHSKEQVFRE